jgi:hypothetical protein
MAASASAHRLKEIRPMTKAATSHIPATHLDVTQSQLIAVDWLDIEQPHGLEPITKTEKNAASSANNANASATRLVVLNVGFRETGTRQV